MNNIGDNEKAKLQIGVLISGGGSNLQAIIDACQRGDVLADVKLVISNKKDAYGLQRAQKAGIKTEIISHKDFSSREEFDKNMDKILQENNIEFVCMAGFMRLLTGWFVNKWQNKLINIHPSLLPSFKGVDGQKQALEYGVKIAGCTVHYVVEEMDAGPIIVQESVEVLDDDTVESLAMRILKKEHIAYVKALQKITG